MGSVVISTSWMQDEAPTPNAFCSVHSAENASCGRRYREGRGNSPPSQSGRKSLPHRTRPCGARIWM